MIDVQSDLLQKIDALYKEIHDRRPLNEGELHALRQSLKVDFTYNSNAIEGSTITHGETKLILEDGITIEGKTLRELHETENHNGMFHTLFDIVDNKRGFTEDMILDIHRLALKGIDDDNAGRYRQIQVRISLVGHLESVNWLLKSAPANPGKVSGEDCFAVYCWLLQ